MICRFGENCIAGGLRISRSKLNIGLAELDLMRTGQEEKLGSDGQEQEDIDGA